MYDAIIVGARCAGSPTAMLLAQKGYRVLLLDRATFPSDTLSGNYIWQPGVARLKRWGLLDQIIASNCPPVTRVSMDLGSFALAGSPPPADGVAEAYDPRRTVLDKILVDAAGAAGAELRERFLVEEIIMDGDRATGICGRAKGGSVVTEKARIVIGADGLHSLVARAVQAPRYNERPALTLTYLTYWSGVPIDAVEFYQRPNHRLVVGVPTNDGLTLIGLFWPHAEFHEFRADIEGNYLTTLEMAPAFAERVRSGRREERFVGTADLPNFFRKPYGPGWALVGDSGYHKDTITAQGITDAFRDAELLAEAIDAGFSARRPLDEALADYQRQRDEASLPMYDLTCQFAALQIPPEMQLLLEALRGNQAETDRFFGAFAGTTFIPEFFSPEHTQRIIDAAQQKEASP